MYYKITFPPFLLAFIINRITVPNEIAITRTKKDEDLVKESQISNSKLTKDDNSKGLFDILKLWLKYKFKNSFITFFIINIDYMSF